MAEYLEKWGLPELLPTFEENGIDEEAMKLLTPDVIKELIPKIGQRIKFLHEWKTEFQKDNRDSPLGMLSESSRHPYLANQCISNDDCWDIASDSHSSGSSDVSVNPASSSEAPFTPPPLKRQKRVYFLAKDILSQNATGRRAAANIEKQMFCSKKDRHVVVDLLTNYMVQEHGDKPSSFIKGALAESLINAFPCLKDPDAPLGYEAWYCKGSSGRPATGYIEDHLRYIRKRAILVGGKEPKADNLKKEYGNTESSPAPDVSEEEAEMMVEWLKTNCTPQDQVKDYMKKTAVYRRNAIMKSSMNVAKIFLEYPRLLDRGQIEQDFSSLYSLKSGHLSAKWSSYAPLIVDYCDQYSDQWKEVLQLDINLDALTQDEKENLAFSMLPLVLRGGTKMKKKTLLPEAVKSFIDIKPEVTDVAHYAKHLNEKVVPQPFVMCRGCRINPSQTYLIIERNVLSYQTLLEAIDACFKCFYVLHIEYQPACYSVWKFFESVVFEMPGGNIPNCVREIRAYLSSRAKTENDHGKTA